MKTSKILLWLVPIILVGIVLANVLLNSAKPQGERLFENNCANCHMEAGKGLQELIPTVRNADYVVNNPEKLACIIRNGIKGEIIVNGKKYNQPMTAAPHLSEIEITNIVNYLLEIQKVKLKKRNFLEIQQDLKTCL